VADVFMYADETGNLDYAVDTGGSKYFGIGTATYPSAETHAEAMAEGLRLRLAHARAGVDLPRGYHAVDDAKITRQEVFDVIAVQAPRFDVTFLAKKYAYPEVKAKGDIYLYRLAWFLHFKEIAKRVVRPGDTLYVIVATLGTGARKKAFNEAIRDVCAGHKAACAQIVVCNWDAATSWGLRSRTTGCGPFSAAWNARTTGTCPRWSRPCRRTSCHGARHERGQLSLAGRGPLDLLSLAGLKYMTSSKTSQPKRES
jgi:hypothetical protein